MQPSDPVESVTDGMEWVVTIRVRVTDAEALRQAAEAWLEDSGVGLEDWRASRSNEGDDLRMLFDPGANPPGCSIEDSSVEACRATCLADAL